MILPKKNYFHISSGFLKKIYNKIDIFLVNIYDLVPIFTFDAKDRHSIMFVFKLKKKKKLYRIAAKKIK